MPQKKDKKPVYKQTDLLGQMKDAIAVQLLPDCEPLPGGTFELMVIDPPWKFSLRESDETHRNRCSYPPMTNEAIAALPIGMLGAKDSYCCLWTTASHLPHAFPILDRWGYTYKTTHVWRKVTKDREKLRIGVGHYGRNCLEFILIGTKGSPGTLMKHGITSMPNIFDGVDCLSDDKSIILPDRALDYMDFLASICWPGADYIFDAPPTQVHSEKPSEFYDRMNIIRENIVEGGANALELFAREKRPGWTVWGAEVDQKLVIAT